MKKALVYVRIIPDTQGRSKQAQDYTMQIQDLERYCKANNYTVTERFEEKPIGNNKDRNFITSLVQYFENHKDTKYFMAQDINKLGKTWEILPIV
jgi:DNA invertase Pin-like site-specific DNA recombinase